MIDNKNFEFVFKHSKDGKIIISASYTITQMMDDDFNMYKVQEDCCHCDCQPTGENSFVECNCQDYYDDFEFVTSRQSTGCEDNGGKEFRNEIFEGDIMEILLPRDSFWGYEEKKKIGVVRYESDYGGFIVEWEWSKNQHHVKLDCDVAFEGKIIGNIYQNKDLLK